MSRLILKTDSADEIVLAEPRILVVTLTAILAVAALAVILLVPARWIAASVLGLGALWNLSGVLKIHQLRLDLSQRAYVYRRGWWLAPPLRQGTLDDVAAVFIDRHEPGEGLLATRLRSRVITLELEGWPEGEGSFVLGFPMGPRVAEEKAADYARRLGSRVVDRTTRSGSRHGRSISHSSSRE